jgi:hypothetical protein
MRLYKITAELGPAAGVFIGEQRQMLQSLKTDDEVV